jgi:hypothetical protein
MAFYRERLIAEYKRRCGGVKLWLGKAHFEVLHYQPNAATLRESRTKRKSHIVKGISQLQYTPSVHY